MAPRWSHKLHTSCAVHPGLEVVVTVRGAGIRPVARWQPAGSPGGTGAPPSSDWCSAWREPGRRQEARLLSRGHASKQHHTPPNATTLYCTVSVLIPPPQTYPSRAGRGELVEGLGQQDLGVADSLSYGVMLLLASEGELGEGRLVTGRVLDVYEVLVVGDAVILGELEQTNQSLEERGPGEREGGSVNLDTSPKQHHVSVCVCVCRPGVFLTRAWCTRCPSWRGTPSGPW